MSIMNNLTVYRKLILEEVEGYPNGRLYAIAASVIIIILWQYWQNTVSRSTLTYLIVTKISSQFLHTAAFGPFPGPSPH
jgi:hypothetical protein